MVPLSLARAYVLERVAPMPVGSVLRTEALGCVTAADIVSPEDVPPFVNSAMDGFALRAADTESAPTELRIVGTLAAGSDPGALEVTAGSAIRIMTGAALPRGADAVVMVERTEITADGERVRVESSAQPGDHVRAAGDDIRAGALVFPAGTELGPGHLGVLASIGVESLDVHRRPRVGILSTGDELVVGGGALRPGQIRDSNRHALVPLVAQAGCEPLDLGVVPDEPSTIEFAIQEAVEECDAVITTGGVSMGDFDWVRRILERLGKMRWMQIAIKPARPFAFGLLGERRFPLFGLPGNPVSSLVSFELLVRPTLRRMLGHEPGDLDRLTIRAVLDDECGRRRPDGKEHFVRVAVRYDSSEARFHARSAGGQGSHQLLGMANANGLLRLPDGDGVAAGGEAEVLLLSLA